MIGFRCSGLGMQRSGIQDSGCPAHWLKFKVKVQDSYNPSIAGNVKEEWPYIAGATIGF